MKIPIDFEYEIRTILSDKYTAYCKPLPQNFSMPCILVTQVGGRTDYNWAGIGEIDAADITLDSRAETDEESFETLRKAIGYLEEQVAKQKTSLLMVEVNTISSTINDPVRPDLKMCTARILTRARREEII